MTDHKALTPQPPLPAGEGEEPAGFDAVIRNQKSNQEEVKEYDEYRTSVFEEKGIKTIRVKNEECDKQHIIKIIDTILSNPR